ncbi:7 transmembrane sweet-taste receptor of 3 GCPR-domain-containing protein [Gaertneriomyces semiglobifer]|nr:7 transmembrane sweet-taste receptor of 3 GCPR-domain-containing protein [Gaertneriomyces semiglobifer]
MEERVTRKDVKYPSCMQVTCSHSCPKAYGVCRHDFCYCFEGREGITCSDFASMRDSISISIASGPSSSLSARDLPDASELDDGSARDQVISEIANALQISETQVYFRSMNKTTGGLAFTFSVTDELGHFIEGHQLDSVRGALLSSDLPVAAIDLVSSMNHHASVSTRGVMTILVLAAMSMVITLIMMGGLVAHRHKPIVRASAVTFSMFILSAAFLACCLPYLYVGIPTDKSCLAQIWVGGIAFALAVGNIIAKNYRIYRIFNAGASATVKVLPDWKIMPISLAILIVELVIDAVWTKLAPLHPSLTDNGDRREWTCNTSSDANGPITMVATIYKILLLVLACILAYKTRDVGDQYSETRAISVASYTMLLSGAVVLPVVLLTDTGGVELEFYLKSVGLLLSLWVTIFVLFGTRLMAVYREYIGTFAWLSSSSSAAPGKGKGISKTSGSEAPKDVAVNENRPETSDNGYRCGVFVDGIFGGWRQGRVHMNAAGSILFLRLSEMERVNAVSFLRALGRGLYANAQKWAGSSLSPNVAIKCAYIQFFAEDENHLSMWIRNRSGTTHIRFLAKEHYEDISGKIKKHVKKAGLVSTVPRSSNKGA